MLPGVNETGLLMSSKLPDCFYARPAEVVAPGLIGCRLVKRQPSGDLLWGVIVETEAYSQEDPACHGYRRRSPSNEMLLVSLGGFVTPIKHWAWAHLQLFSASCRGSGCLSQHAADG